MFDIGFAELLIIGVVGLLVIGPERLPGAIRTGSAWLNRLRRGFNDIRQEVQQELHNDAVLRELRESGEKLRRETESLQRDFSAAGMDDSGSDKAAAREHDSGDQAISTADQSAGHRETPAPFMRSNPRPSAAQGAQAAGEGNGADETRAPATTDTAEDSGDRPGESPGHKS
ncbi:MAG: Sec-independent protein translocase protein TatB [Halieaceae bacterium]|jgi:sec-independent protein translocase protein TatB|nr:Sec-independent protein translocase protein TatB [Halieaceae bacterium]